jgi:hypothetical protein
MDETILAYMGQTENAYEALVGKPEWKKIPV